VYGGRYTACGATTRRGAILSFLGVYVVRAVCVSADRFVVPYHWRSPWIAASAVAQILHIYPLRSFMRVRRSSPPSSLMGERWQGGCPAHRPLDSLAAKDRIQPQQLGVAEPWFAAGCRAAEARNRWIRRSSDAANKKAWVAVEILSVAGRQESAPERLFRLKGFPRFISIEGPAQVCSAAQHSLADVWATARRFTCITQDIWSSSTAERPIPETTGHEDADAPFC